MEANAVVQRRAQHLTGLIAAPLTAMHEDGSVNLDQIPRQVELLVRGGVKGAFVCGTTGESMSLSVEERMEVAEAWKAASGDRLQLIVHVGHTSLPDAQRLAAHAQQIGADAVAAMAPCFFRPKSAGDLVAFCADLAAAAPDLPFYYYHIPSMTGVHVQMYDFLQALGDRIPTFAGIKFTHEDLMDFARCVRFAGGKYNMLFGRDEILLTGLILGARGAVGSTYNFAAHYYQDVLRAFEAGDMEAARSAQARATDMIAAFVPFGGIPAQKAIMRMIGVDCGPPRLPLTPLSDEAYDDLRTRLESLGFFSDWEEGYKVTAQDVSV